MRPPWLARRLRSMKVEVALQLGRRRRRRARPGRLARCPGGARWRSACAGTARSALRTPMLAVHPGSSPRRPRSTPPVPARTPASATTGRGRATARAPRSVVRDPAGSATAPAPRTTSTVPAFGLPSWSPPIQSRNAQRRRRAGQVGGATRRPARPRRAAGSSRRTRGPAGSRRRRWGGSSARRRTARGSSPPRRSRRRCRCAAWRRGRGASSSCSSSARCSWLCRKVRRAASVGCAVSTSSRCTSSRAARTISVSERRPRAGGRPHRRCSRAAACRRRAACGARRAPARPGSRGAARGPSARTSSVRSSSARPSMAARGGRPATVPARRAAAASATARSTIEMTWPPASSAIAVRSAPASNVTSRSSSSWAGRCDRGYRMPRGGRPPVRPSCLPWRSTSSYSQEDVAARRRHGHAGADRRDRGRVPAQGRRATSSTRTRSCSRGRTSPAPRSATGASWPCPRGWAGSGTSPG